jgi:ABC transport system ATP-binding/permease protein
MSQRGNGADALVLDPRRMTLLAARALTKAYGADPLFSNLEFAVEEGDRIGLLGINGTGKSTLLRVLAGLEPSDTGAVEKKRGATILYLAQEPELPADASAEEVVLAGLGDWYAAKLRYDRAIKGAEDGVSNLDELGHASEELDRLGGWDRGHVALDMITRLGLSNPAQKVGTMSGGERRRVALARILVAKPDLAILDEPTNHLDADTIEWLETYLLEEYPGALLFVTHDRYVLDTVATRIFELDRGSLRAYEGGYEDFLEKKAELLAHEARAESNRLNILRREKAWLMRGAKARTTKQKARIQRAEAMVQAAPPKAREKLVLEAAATRSGKSILDLKKADIGLPGRPLVQGLEMSLVIGDRIGIVGPNGVGKTTFFRTVVGDIPPLAGEVKLGQNTKVAYFDQSRANLENDWSIYDNVAEREGAERVGGGTVAMGERVVELRTYLEQFLFDPSKQRQKVGSLSGGERARVALAKLLKGGANLLMLDEPTNDLDTQTLAAMEDMLTSWPGTLLVISHDRYFLNRVATAILAFDPATHNGTLYPGGYDDYRRMKSEEDAAAKAQPPAPVKVATAPAVAAAPAPKGKLTYAERKEFDGILDKVAEAEAQVASVEKSLADPDLYAKDPARAGALQRELDAAHGVVTKLMSRWEELEKKSSGA